MTPDSVREIQGHIQNPYGSCYSRIVHRGRGASHALQVTADTLRGSIMHGLKALLGTTALLAGLAMAPAAKAQVVVGIGIQPVCSYGYYDYAPYACSPMGFYGPGYFYNGIFLGMGPWAGWGYGHGWGSHRFVAAGGGSYRGGGGAAAARGHYGGTQAARNGGAVHNREAVNARGARPSAGHAAVAHDSKPQARAAHASASHAAATHGGEHPGGGHESEHK
jgi:hypothetical protein